MVASPLAARRDARVTEAAKLWLERTQDLEPTTVRQYRSHVAHIEPLIGDAKLARLTTPAVQRFVDQLVSEGRCPRPLARKVLSSLKSLISEAQKRGLIAQNVARAATVKIGARHRRRVEIPGKAEITKLIDGAEGRARALIVTAAFTGLRSSELRGLRWQDVDFAGRLIHVRQRADEGGKMGSLKSERAHRSVPISQQVISTLKEWKVAAPPGAALVFCNGVGKVESHANLVHRELAPLQDRLRRHGAACTPSGTSTPV